jgi:hypothetical protein
VAALAKCDELVELDLGYCELASSVEGVALLERLRVLRLGPRGTSGDTLKALGALPVQDLVLGFPDRGAASERGFLVAPENVQGVTIDELKGEGDLAALRKMTNLRDLSIGRLATGGKGKTLDLTAMERLRSLRVGNAGETEGIKLRLPPRVLELCLPIEAAGVIDAIEPLRHVEILTVDCRLSEPDANAGPGLRKLFGLCPSLHRVVLEATTETALEQLARVGSLAELHLGYGPPISEAGVIAISNVKGLESLSTECGFKMPSDRVEAAIAKMSHLRRLTSPIGRDCFGFAAAARKLADLRALGISTGEMGEGCLQKVAEYVGQLDKLDELELEWRGPNTLLKAASGLKRLRSLTLRSMAIEDADLARLSSLKELRVMNLEDSAGYGDDALAKLMESLPNLREVRCRGFVKKIDTH